MSTGIRQSVRHARMLGVVAPFAAASSGANTFLLLTKAMAKFIKVLPRSPSDPEDLLVSLCCAANVLGHLPSKHLRIDR